MPINFLNSVDFGQNQLLKPRIENQSSDTAAGTGVEGQLYMDTAAHVLKFHKGTSWVAVANAAAAGVASLTASGSTFINVAQNTTTGTVTLITSLSATGSPNATTFLCGDNTWKTISGVTNLNYIASPTNGQVTSSTGTTATITLADATNAGLLTPDKFTVLQNTTNTNSGDNAVNSLYSGLAASKQDAFIGTGIVKSTAGVVSYITDNSGNWNTAYNNRITSLTVTGSSGSATLAANVLNIPTYTLTGLGGAPLASPSFTGTPKAPTPTAGDSTTNIATTAFVTGAINTAVTGLLEFKGGFNANTGQITSGTNTGLFLFGAARVAVAVGDYYVVTTAGNFYANTATPLTPGDSVIATVARAANLSIEADWSIVQSDTDLATASTVGIGNVAAGNGISVSYSNGTATVTNISGKKVILSSAATGVTKATAGGVTTFTINLTTAWAAGIEASNVMCEVIDSTTWRTAYAEIGRTSLSSTSMTVAMTGTIADSAYYVLLHNIE